MQHRFTGQQWGLLVLCWLLCLSVSWAQSSRTITGRVIAKSDGKGLPGANVLVKGKTVGAVTDADGAFTISAEPNVTLTVSYIGFLTQEFVLGNE
ncbi:MAG: hypothetical protein EOO61_23190, partial [Hymenobacter sp.]